MLGNLELLKAYNTDEIIIIFMDQNGRILEIKDKANLAFLNNEQKRYCIEPRTRKHVKRYGFLSFARSITNKYGKQLLDITTKAGLDALTTASRKVAHKAAVATGDFLGTKIADAAAKSYNNKIVKSDENSRNVEEIVILPVKRQAMLNELIQVLQKWNAIKYLNY